MVRMLVPTGIAGTYMLFRGGEPVYIGRSDVDLRRRLLAHASSQRGEYFTFQTYESGTTAFQAECALFHAPPSESIENKIHPASPTGSAALCPYCTSTVELARKFRTDIRPKADQPDT
ncbi:hypothetical protein ACQPW3_34725 [Actinosynnema sp. CA-248983]